MIAVTVDGPADFNSWKAQARSLLHHQIEPEAVSWSLAGEAPSLFAASARTLADLPEISNPAPVTAPPAFLSTAERVICHRDPERFAKLYRILWRLKNDRRLMGKTTDPDIIWMTECDKAVRRDRHKMHAFVRFRKVGEGRYRREQFAAWFEPTHFITRLATPFFMRRFPNMDWVIVTPDCTAIWDGHDLKFSPGGKKSDVPETDALEAHWKTYFTSIFNPARLKVGAMMSEMPKKYWHNMPEAVEIPEMIARAREREHHMAQNAVSTPHPLSLTLKAQNAKRAQEPAPLESLEAARSAVQACTLCPLYCDASQAVFGRGPEDAKLMIIGEQPGDEEDIAGAPFVGPAGQVLNAALAGGGLNRDEIYITNAVKHFKFKARGKRRIHQRPNTQEIDHCRWWLKTEVKWVQPKVMVAMGATAARSILNKAVKISDVRGRALPMTEGRTLIITYHPSYILRVTSDAQKQAAQALLTQDLQRAHALSIA